MKITARKICLAMYLAAGVAAMSSFMAAHGGWRGDVDPDLYHFNVVLGRWSEWWSDISYGPIIFNRWKIRYEQEPLTFRLFVYANLPAMALAVLLHTKVLMMFKLFSYYPYPLGISRATYYFVSFLIFGFGQWFLIGTLIDKWRSRKARLR